MPRRPLTNVDLVKFVNVLKIPNFRGVYMRDRLPSKIKTKETGIVNLDTFTGRGTHWTAYVKNKTEIQYFDSIGNLAPPLELVKYFSSDGQHNTINYNFDRFQSLNAYNCGHLCLLFLYTNTVS